MIQKLDIADTETALQIWEMERLSYQIEAELIGFDDIPPLRETLDTLQRSDEIFYGYYVEDVLAGIIAYTLEENCMDICRVAVHPSFFRRGIARRLLEYAEYLHPEIGSMKVCTGVKNFPAIALYEKAGFQRVGEIHAAPGLLLVCMYKIRASASPVPLQP